jgi:hypothetical protein
MAERLQGCFLMLDYNLHEEKKETKHHQFWGGRFWKRKNKNLP